MSSIARSLIVLFGLSGLGPHANAQAEPKAAPRQEAVPRSRGATVLRFFNLEGELKLETLRKAVADLGTRDAESKITFGPQSSSTRPHNSFTVLELPLATTVKDVQRALKKSCDKVDELAWTAFSGKQRELPSLFGYSPRECVIGMASDLRWFEFHDGIAEFFYVPGKLDAKQIADHFRTLYQPEGDGDLGKIVHRSLACELQGPVDAAAARRAETAIAKIAGVRQAHIDIEKSSLRYEVELDGLRTSSIEAFANKEEKDAADHRASTHGFATAPIFEALDKEKIQLFAGK